jgi:hypothetical protein
MERTARQNLMYGKSNNLGTACMSILNIVGHLTYLSNSNARILLKTAHLVIYALSRFTPHLGYTRGTRHILPG